MSSSSNVFITPTRSGLGQQEVASGSDRGPSSTPRRLFQQGSSSAGRDHPDLRERLRRRGRIFYRGRGREESGRQGREERQGRGESRGRGRGESRGRGRGDGGWRRGEGGRGRGRGESRGRGRGEGGWRRGEGGRGRGEGGRGRGEGGRGRGVFRYGGWGHGQQAIHFHANHIHVTYQYGTGTPLTAPQPEILHRN